MIDLLVEIAGWMGMILLLGSYGLLSMKKMDSQMLSFQWMNISGAILLAVNTLYHGAIPSTLLNVVWILIGLGTVVNIIRHKRSA